MHEDDPWTRRRFLARMSAAVAASCGGVMTLESHATRAAGAANDLPRKGDTPFESHPGLDTMPGTLTTRDGFGFQASIPLDRGLRETAEWYRACSWL